MPFVHFSSLSLVRRTLNFGLPAGNISRWLHLANSLTKQQISTKSFSIPWLKRRSVWELIKALNRVGPFKTFTLHYDAWKCHCTIVMLINWRGAAKGIWDSNWKVVCSNPQRAWHQISSKINVPLHVVNKFFKMH